MTSWRARQMPARRYGALLLVLAFLVVMACSGGADSQSESVATATQAPTATGGIVLCAAGDLEASAFYQGATMSMAGGITVTHVSSAPCVVQGRPDVRLTDGEGNALDVVQGEFAIRSNTEAVLLLPGEKAGVFFVWRNWCPPGVRETTAGSAIPGGVVFLVNLPQDGGQLTVPATDPSGRSLGLVPVCNAPGVTSTISVGSFERSVTN